MDGEVKFFDEVKGWGYIIGEDNNDYFFHRSDVANNDSLIQGNKVKFNPSRNNRGLKATTVLKK